jgi:hypothetical protein
MIAAISGDFFSNGALETFGGCTLATIAVGNAVSAVLKAGYQGSSVRRRRGLCFLLAAESDSLDNVRDVIVAFVNGCLVFVLRLASR